jgi:hypothetical protein
MTDLHLPPLGSPLRWPAAAAALVAAAAHVPVIPEHLREVPYVGALFVGLVVVCVVGAGALALRDTPIVWGVLSAVCLSAVTAYAVSRGVGLPGMPDDIGDWNNPLGVISVTSEALATVLGAVAMTAHRSGALSAAS